jgi:hypothetical protein
MFNKIFCVCRIGRTKHNNQEIRTPSDRVVRICLRFRINVLDISDVSPMSAAFNAMHERTNAKYVIQLDEDMDLYLVSILFLVAVISLMPKKIHRVSLRLYQPGFGAGGAVKIWDTQTIRELGFRDVRTVDREFEQRARSLGFKSLDLPLKGGLHLPTNNLRERSIKEKADVQKWIYLKRVSSMYLKPRLSQIHWLDDYSHMGSLIGIVAGILESDEMIGKSKDSRLEDNWFDQNLKHFTLRGDISPEDLVRIKNLVIKVYEIRVLGKYFPRKMLLTIFERYIAQNQCSRLYDS